MDPTNLMLVPVASETVHRTGFQRRSLLFQKRLWIPDCTTRFSVMPQKCFAFKILNFALPCVILAHLAM